MEVKPKTVIFIDDEFDYVQSVVTSLEKQGIECIGFHYTDALAEPCELNPAHGRFQVEYFIHHDIWLDDHACQELLKIN